MDIITRGNNQVQKAEKIIGKEKAGKLVEYLITAVDENR